MCMATLSALAVSLSIIINHQLLGICSALRESVGVSVCM